MTTARDIISFAFRAAGLTGVGQVPSAEDITEGFDLLNDLIFQYNRKRWICYHLLDTSFTANGNQFYTVGSGGNFNLSPRPDRLEKAYFVQIQQPTPSLPPSYPLDLLQSYEDYADITLKTLVSWPEKAFYDSAYPTAKLYVWPIPTSGVYTIHILTKDVLQQFTNLSTVVNLPGEYDAALKWNLVQRVKAIYPRAQEDPIQAQRLLSLAKDSLNVIRQANTQIPRLRLPAILTRHGRYNVYSDRSN